MSLLQNRFFLALVAIFLLSGYSIEAIGNCHPEKENETAVHATDEHHADEQHTENDCQCFCHSGVLVEPAALLETTGLQSGAFVFAGITGKFPPDSLPLGIDYPPQLG